MRDPGFTAAPDGSDARTRRATALGRLAFMAVIGAGVLATTPGLALALRSRSLERLRDVLSSTVDTRGIDAALVQYRTLRAQGFPGVHESERDTNALGYAWLDKGQTRTAIELFRLNVETHSRSANVYDSLAEAYLAAGDTPRAIENYEKALALDPRKKSAADALRTLVGLPARSYPPLVLFHIAAGLVGILSGVLAMLLRKGSPRHAVVGKVFVFSMLGMSASGAYRAFVAPDGDPINVLVGLLTFYLVASGWGAARRAGGGTGPLDWAGLLLALAVATGLARHGLQAVVDDTSPAVVLFSFGAAALLAAAADLRMIVQGGVGGAERIARHLSRMSAGLFIAVTSLFLGRPQIFPPALRRSGLLAVPSLLVVIALAYWWIRVSRAGRPRKTARPKATLAVGQMAT